VTGEDYAARARAVPGVRRAWAVAGALPGIAWHGARTVVTDRKGTVTLLVERGPDAAPDTTDDDFLRRVIAEVLGESDHPWSSLGARRLLGDEIGAALVRHHPVTLTGTLHAPAGVEPAVVLAAARARVRAYLNAGRAHPTPGSESIGRGPWPDRPQPASGWQPGEPIPVTELVQALADDPTVLGVSDLHASLKDGPVVRAPARVRVGAALAATGTPTVDGVALAAGDRVLLCGQDRPGDNGVYVAGPGAWPRADDLSTGDSLCGVLVPVADGSDAGTVWAQTGDAPITVGSTPLVWERSERTVLEPTRVVMTTAVTPSGQPRLSGVRLFAGDRVLLTGQADARENGGYVVAVGAWTRAADSTLVTGLSGAATRILEGVDADSTWWLATSAPIEVGVTEQVWVRTSQPQPPSSSQTGDIQVPAGGVPVLAEHDCLQVRLTLGPGADDA
jgi:hypothetical protein